MQIACPHFKISIRQRSKRQSAVAGAAYQSGEKLFSEYDRRTKNYSYKSPEVVCAEILLPPNAPREYADRQTLWNAAEKAETQWNAQLSRGVIAALPREIPQEQYGDLVRDFCMEQFVSKGMCVDFAVHDKGDGNPHAHIMLTMRSMDETEKWNPKAHKVYELDENGDRIVLPSGEYKTHKENVVDWNDRRYAEVWRASWADTVNRYYERNDCPVRIDLCSYERQGIGQVPTVHLGPAVAHMEAKGIETEIGSYNREIKTHNAIVKSLRSLISFLEAWFAETKEKLSRLFTREKKRPSLSSLIFVYGDIRKQGRTDWSNSAKQKQAVVDLKLMNAAVNWLDSIGIYTMEDFEALTAEVKLHLDRITANEKQIKKLDTATRHIETLIKYKPVHDQSKRGFKRMKAKYAEEYKDELEAFNKAVRYLKANELNASDVEEYRSQCKALKAENVQTSAQLRKLNLDPGMLRKVCQCVDTVLSYADELPEHKRSITEKLRQPSTQPQLIESKKRAHERE